MDPDAPQPDQPIDPVDAPVLAPATDPVAPAPDTNTVQPASDDTPVDEPVPSDPVDSSPVPMPLPSTIDDVSTIATPIQIADYSTSTDAVPPTIAATVPPAQTAPAPAFAPVVPPVVASDPIEAAAPAFDEKSFIKSYLDRLRPQSLASRRAHREEHLARIMALVLERGVIHRHEIVETLHVSARGAEKYCQELILRGLLQRQGKGNATRYERV